MKEEKEKMKTAWGSVVLGALLMIMGVVMVIQGLDAYHTGAIIPATRKSGPMTGLQSLVTGGLAAISGLAFLAYEVLKVVKRQRKESNQEDSPTKSPSGDLLHRWPKKKESDR